MQPLLQVRATPTSLFAALTFVLVTLPVAQFICSWRRMRTQLVRETEDFLASQVGNSPTGS